MNRRVQGRVKHAQKRAKVRADIRAGRRISMQAFVNGSAAHTHEAPETEVAVAVEPTGTHMLVRVEAPGQETEVDRGTESQMRTKRARLLKLLADSDLNITYSVRKIK